MSHHKCHLVPHIQNPRLKSDNTLHVIGVISNVTRYHSRYRLFREWYREMKETPNVEVYVVEMAFGDRPFEVTEACNPNHLQVRSHQPIWLKENMINLGVRRLLPNDWKYLCWSDCDVFWRDSEWAQESLHQLQHYPLIQPWRDCVDLGYQGTILQHFKSFCYQYRRGVPIQRHPGESYEYAHSGFAWACTRAWFEAVHGLMDFSILGSADHHMAWASIGHVEWSIHGRMGENFKKLCKEWQYRSFRATHGRLGFTPTRIEHEFHGPKKRRQYRERWQILIDHKFDPVHDLTYDPHGLVHLIGKQDLEQSCLDYMIYRLEDSIEEG